MYKALSRASVVIELIEDVEQYEATVVSTNGVILQPYDTSTTLIGTVLKNKTDITNEIKNVKWTKWNPTEDNLIECLDWNKTHKGMRSIQIGKDDVDSKSIFCFEAYNDYDELLCSSSISIIDINDLLVSTKKPEEPYVGQLWIDDSNEPATLYVWNGYKWIVSGSVGAIVKNLLKNTSFIYDISDWDIIGNKDLSQTPYASDYIGHRFLTLKSDIISEENRGISQTTTDIININSEYSFQMIFYSKEDTETFSNNIIINIYSIGNDNEETLIHSKKVLAIKKLQRLFTTFKTLNDTKDIRVEILGEANYRYNFNVGELAIYNTWNNYPWTINPADLVLKPAYTQEELWNILSNNGTVQGIFSRTNPETGQLDYYINASMIGAGKVKADFIEMYGMKIKHKETGETTLYITENGEVNMNASKITISSGQTLEEAFNEIKISINQDGIKQTVIETIAKDEDVKYQIQSVAEQTASGFINTVEDRFNGKISAVEQTVEGFDIRITDVENEQESLIELTSKGVYVGAGNTFIDINGNKITVSANDVSIDAENIKLEGYTTINEGFSIDLEGNMSAKNGKFEGTISSSQIESSILISPNIKSDNSDNPKFTLTEDGTLTALNAVIKGEMSGTIVSGDIFKSSNDKFAVLPNGTLEAVDANIKGNINAGSTITGSVINGGKIIGTVIQNAENSPTFTVSSEGIITGAQIKGGSVGIGGTNYDAFTVDGNGNCNITKGSINIGNGNFIVNNDGHLIARSAEISAEMSADIGYIAGFKIDRNTLTTHNVGISSATQKDDITFWAGSNTPSEAFFKVTNGGKVYASNADIKGSVTATNGKIGGYEIGDYKLTASNVGMCSNEKEGWAFWAGSDTSDSAPFRVSHTGEVYGTNISIDGGSVNVGTLNGIIGLQNLSAENIVTLINDNESIINSSKIQLNNENQTLDFAFTQLKDQITTNTTSISVAQGEISKLISNTTVVKENGQIVQLKDEYNSIVDTVNSHTQTISSLETNISKAGKETIIEYYVSNSPTVQSGGSWSTAALAPAVGKYIWQRTKTVSADNTITYSDPVCITNDGYTVMLSSEVLLLKCNAEGMVI